MAVMAVMAVQKGCQSTSGSCVQMFYSDRYMRGEGSIYGYKEV
jgi:hypothetical protein